MAVASDDWPRFSLRVGGWSPTSFLLRPANESVEQELLQIVTCSAATTCKCWFKFRTEKRHHSNFEELERVVGCWLVRTPRWACGTSDDGVAILRYESTWFISSLEAAPAASSFRFRKRQWYHIAVSVETSCSAIALYVDGQRIPLHPSPPLQGGICFRSGSPNDLERCSCTQMSKQAPPFAIGYPGAARVDADSEEEWTQMWLVLHEFRIWRCNLDEHVLTSWMQQSVSPMHPYFGSLAAHWSLSSGSASSEELDLSGHARHLIVVYSSDSNCRFLVTIKHRSQYRNGDQPVHQQQQQLMRPRIVFICNFRAAKNASVTELQGHGKWTIKLLRACIRDLPEHATVGILKPGVSPAEVLPLTQMSAAGKTIGDKDACLTLHESNDENPRDDCSPVQCVRYGLCEQEEPLVLSGVISFSDKSVSPNIATNCLPFVELRFQWVDPGNQVHVAWTSLRLRQDVTDEMHIARVARNQMLSLRHDNNSVLLLAQRRQLIDEKAQFHHALARDEVATLENAFKRVSIMKEELWARRKRIVERGLRKFEEDELFVLEQEAVASVERFQARFDTLQHQYTVNARENSRGGGADNHSSSHHVLADHYLADLCSLNASRGEHEPSDELAQQYEKITLKVDLLTKRFHDIESRMEDMVHSDLMDSSDSVLAMRRQKPHIEQRLLFLEHEREVTERMLAETKAINSSILRYEKEPVKRKQRVFLSMKDMLRVLVDEFETSMAVDTAERIERQCKLLRAPALDATTMLSSCIHVFFPLEVSEKESPSSHRHRHNNAAHAWLFGLRHFCVDATQEPFCKCICLQEHFLWLDQEQSELEDQEDSAGVDAGRQECWAVILVTYNALFSSPTAIHNLKSVLASAEQAHKPVLHVELEALFANVDEFKAIWQLDAVASMKSSAYPVEKECLAWKHNVGAFQAAMRSLHRSSTTTTASSEPSKLQFTSIPVPSNACLTASATNDVTIVKATGEWVDGLTVVATQTAVRSHNLDPSKNAPLSMSLEQWWRNERKLREAQWEEAFARRKVELQRQVGKLFKNNEQKLVCTLTELKEREDATESPQRANEATCMVEQELVQLLSQTDSCLLRLKTLEDMEDDDSDPGNSGAEQYARAAEEARQAFRESLKLCTRHILELGKVRVETQLVTATKRFAVQEACDQSHHLSVRSRFEQQEISRVAKVYDRGLSIVADLVATCHSDILGDARAFLEVARMEQRELSRTTSEGNLESWLVSSMAMCQKKRANLVALLCCITTEADSRDAAGNTSNVIYGASLTSSEIKQLYASHVTPSRGASQPQPWNVVLVVVFFARLFRCAALQCRSAHRSLAELYDAEHSIEMQAQQLATIRAHETRQPSPTGLEIVNAANNVIQIKWLPIADEPALMYAAEVRLGGPKEGKDASYDPAAAPRWERSVCNTSSNGSHSFCNLRMNATYYVRVCAGFSASRWGSPSAPLFVKTRATPGRHVLKSFQRRKQVDRKKFFEGV
ncbi:hypothetical protein FI667_g4390, partial [Globisporangium splendens]